VRLLDNSVAAAPGLQRPGLDDDRAIDDIDVGALGDELHLPLDFVGEEIVVGVEVLKPGPPGEREQPIPSHIGTTVRAHLPADVLAEAPEDFEAPVGRTIVDHNNFRRRVGLT
jgi:hypothetical protein